MPVSILLKVREIPDETSLIILSNSGAGGKISSCNDDGASQVDGTGIPTINMLMVDNKYISPHNYTALYLKLKL